VSVSLRDTRWCLDCVVGQHIGPTTVPAADGRTASRVVAMTSGELPGEGSVWSVA
jgi:hypothetical protein